MSILKLGKSSLANTRWGSAALVCSLVLALANAAAAQSTTQPFFPGNPNPDRPEVEEVDPQAEDGEYLPDLPQDNFEHNERIAAAQSRELDLNSREIVGKARYLALVSLGTAVPWQTYGFSLRAIWSPGWMFGVVAGAGSYQDEGVYDERAFTMELRSRSALLTADFRFANMPSLSVGGQVGYGSWDGNIDPAGADTVDDIEATLLPASIEAHGPIVGVRLTVSGAWQNGLYLEWTPVALRKSWAENRSLSRESPVGRQVMERKFYRPAIYGLTNLSVGYLF